MPNELAFTAPPLLTGGGRVLPSPAAFYLTGEDRLRITSYNAYWSLGVAVHWRTARSDGSTVANSETHIPNTDRTAKTNDYELGSGSLLNVTVFISSTGAAAGTTFVIVQLVRGIGPAAIVLGTLLAGYVTASQALGWPGSPISSSLDYAGALISFTASAPAPGVEIVESVPQGARWELVAFRAVLTTSAVAGARDVALGLRVIGGLIAEAIQSAAVGPGTSFGYSWGEGLPSRDNVQTRACAPLGHGIVLPGALATFETLTRNMQAGDQWGSIYFLVREWLEVA